MWHSEKKLKLVGENIQMNENERDTLQKIANTIRQLSMEAVEKANSGHPGLPLGCAELGAYLYGHLLKHNPKHSRWLNRDRLFLSAGHGSMWLYSCLHLSGFNLSLDEIERFRQLHSHTPGHPEFRDTDGVEATTGPLGQGIGNAIGHALGLKILATKFNTSDFKVIDNKVYCLAGDGCLQEGVSAEASSFAGHLGLDNIVLIHDANKVTLDGPLSQSSSENVPARYKAYGWDTYEVDGHDLDALHSLLTELREHQTKPVFITCRTIIGKGSPNKAGTHNVHGSPLGPEELIATKKALGLPEEPFYVPQDVKEHFAEKLKADQELEDEWTRGLSGWKKANPQLAEAFQKMTQKTLPEDLEEKLTAIDFGDSISGRKAGQAVLQVLGKELPYLIGGSADLSGSDCTMMKDYPLIEPGNFKGRNIKYGIREFSMATEASGLYLTDMLLPYIGTFLTFSDYMRNAIRLAALSHYQVIYQFTHDSIFLGEDGPTHQPIEHYAALRAMPNLYVIRPGDAHEVKGAYLAAITHKGPTAIILSRQNLRVLKETNVSYRDGVSRGGYIVLKEKGKCDFCLFATGSELQLALDVATELGKRGKNVRVVSMPCWELFEKQKDEYKQSVLGGDLGKRVSIEAGVAMGWERYIGPEGIAICMDTFGLSAPMSDLAAEFGFTVDSILSRIM